MANRLILLLCVSSLLFFYFSAVPAFSDVIDDDEDLKFLEAEDENDGSIKDEDVKVHESSHDDDDFDMPSDIDDFDDDDVDDGDGDGDVDVDDVVGNVDDDGYAYEDEESHLHPQVDDRDVVVLTEKNFTDFIESNKYVMVEFYAPWCGHCKAMAPEYAAAATELKGWETQKVMLAKVKATEESDLAEEYNVEGFPTLYFFTDGKHKPYHGQRSKQAIVTWIKKKIGPGFENITTTADAERILTAEEKVVLGFLNSLVGPESEELAAVSKVHDDVNFYQTVNPDVAKMFHLEPSRKCPSLVLLKKVAEKVAIFDGEFTNPKINEFVFTNKIPLMTILTNETAQMIFESPIKKQVLLFTSSNDSAKVLSTFQEAAKLFQGKLIFILVEMDDSEIGGPIAEYFGVEGITPNVLGYMRDDNHRYMFDDEITLENLKVFGTDFVEDKLKPYYRSDPIPETNDGDVKIVVGNNFDEIVLDESKDVLLEVYAPWCGYCQAFEPTYNKLAKHLHGIESLVIAKMDGTTNEHPRVKASGYPTLLFFPAGPKSSDPIAVNSGRTVVELYKFIKKHASIPFKLHKQNTTTSVGFVNQSTTTTGEIKDEL